MLKIGPGLIVRIGSEVTEITPARALRAAEALVRRAMESAMREEAGIVAPPRRPHPAARRRASAN